MTIFANTLPFAYDRRGQRSAAAVSVGSAILLTALIYVSTPAVSSGAMASVTEDSNSGKMSKEIVQLPTSSQPDSVDADTNSLQRSESQDLDEIEELVTELESGGELPSAPRITEGTLLRTSTASNIYFTYGSALLTSSAMEWIRRHAERLRAKPGLKVTLYGYADDFASGSYSIALGALRTQAVREQLLARKVSPSQIRVTSYGHEKSIGIPCQTEVCHESYRRVEFRYELSRN